MEKKLKKVQRGAAVGFVLLKILRILLIVAAVVMIVSLVVLAVVNENDLPLDAVKDGKLVLTLQDLNLNQLGLDNVPDIGALVKDGVLTLDLKDAKLVVMLLVGVGILVLAAAYILMLIAGNLFKHIKKEDTPFTTGNIRRLRLLGIFHIVFWVCGIAMGYFVGSEFIRRLGLPNQNVTLSLNITTLLLSLIYFFLARVFSFGKAQGEALQASLSAPEPEPAPVYEAPAPVYEAPAPVVVPEDEPVKPEPVFTPEPEPIPEPIPAPEAAPEAAPAEAVEAPAEPEA